MPRAYPLMLDVTTRRALIVGGGGVALRKIRSLIESGCKSIRVVAPQIDPRIPAQIERHERPFKLADLDDATLVFAATSDPAVNAQVVRECQSRNILVSGAGAIATDELRGDFSTPARLTRGPITISVSAGSPALSAFIRDRLAAQFDPSWTDLAQLTAAIRRDLKDDPAIAPEERRWIMRLLATEQAAAAVRAGGPQALRDWLAAQNAAPVAQDPAPSTTP